MILDHENTEFDFNCPKRTETHILVPSPVWESLGEETGADESEHQKQSVNIKGALWRSNVNKQMLFTLQLLFLHQ